jgi:DNA polymerase-4
VSVGVAANKLVAKVAAGRDKPGGLTVVPVGEEVAFLAPLPVRVLWGVGPVTARRLESLGIHSVGDLQRQSREELWGHLGKTAAWLLRQARGQDRRPVSSARERKSVSRERTFSHDILDEQDLLDQIRSLSGGLERRLERANLGAGTIALKVRYSDFTTFTRQMKMTVPAMDSESIYLAAAALLRRGWKVGQSVRLLGVIARDLRPAPLQPRLLRMPVGEPSPAERSLPE